MSYIDDLEQAAAEALAASSSATDSAQIMEDVANGDENTTVTTANGEVKTLAKAIKDIIDSIEAGVEAPQVEPQTLSAGQTTVSLTTMTTEGIAVYVEGSREFDFTVTNSTDFNFSQSFPDGTRIWIVKRDIEGVADSFTVNTSTGTQTLVNALEDRGAVFDSVADLNAATNLQVGQKVRTLGYYTPGDGGGNDYEIVAAGTGTDDGGSFIDLSGSGLQAKGLFLTGVKAKQFGAVGDGVADDSTAIENASSLGDVLLPEITRISSLTVAAGSRLIGVPKGSELYCINGDGIVNITCGLEGLDILTAFESIVFIAENVGGTCIETPKGAGVFFNNMPRYRFESLLFKGMTQGSSSSVWEYVEGWEKCVSVGDAFSVRMNRLSIYGTYNQEIEESLSPESNGIFLDGTSSVRAVRITNYQTVNVKYPLNIGENVTSVWLKDFDLVLSHTGILDTHVANSGELQIISGYLNAQYAGAKLFGRSWTFINDVNVTRHPAGFDHSDPWNGLDLGIDFNEASISNMRILDAGTWANVGTRTGVLMDDVLRSKFNGITMAADNGSLDFGFALSNSSLDNIFDNSVFNDVDTFWSFGPGTLDISVGNYEYRGSVTEVFSFDATISNTSIANNFRLSGFHLNSITTDTNRFPQVKLKRPAREWTIQNASNDNLIIRDVTSGENRMLFSDGAATISAGGKFRPTIDNTHSLGDASFRWSEVFAAAGTINTSDEREKTELLSYEDAELAVARQIKSIIRKFRFKDAVQSKGEDARIHFGVGAQSVAQCFVDNGLDPDRYAMFCYDEWPDEIGTDGEIIAPAGNRYGIRYEELLSFILGAI